MARDLDPIIAELKRLRLSRRLTTRQVAAAIGVTHSSVAVWESGATSPRLADVRSWAHVFDRGPALAELLEEGASP